MRLGETAGDSVRMRVVVAALMKLPHDLCNLLLSECVAYQVLEVDLDK